MRAGPEGGRRGPEPGDVIRDRPIPSALTVGLHASGRWEERTGARPSRGFAQDARGKQLSSALGTASALDPWQKLGLRALKPGRGHCQEVRAWPSRLIH
ncbi:unnamed protein product [Rangifer tarandus platyrhynchus]|uniref:Uncharacterized protein n=1 Tax=Rangifer tarandus platyrhynchus TaxID=3082113 RepID=A0ABN8Z005_RANTA|nr:unnamed protein product [Rangifer tarandus platyrhynchus]